MSIPKLITAGVVFAVLAVACGAAGAADPEGKESQLPSLPPPVEVDGARQKWLLDYISALSDIADFENPHALGNLLHMDFSDTHQEWHSEKLCNDHPSLTTDQRNMVSDAYNPINRPWFKAMPDSVQNMYMRPSFFLTRGQHLPGPNVDFVIAKTATCGGRHKTTPKIWSRLSFDTIQGFVCITQQQLQSLLPRAESRMKNDKTVFSYVTQVSEEKGVLVTFYFFSDNCMVDASMEEDESYGRRAARLIKQHSDCLKQKEAGSGDAKCGGEIPELLNRE